MRREPGPAVWRGGAGRGQRQVILPSLYLCPSLLPRLGE